MGSTREKLMRIRSVMRPKIRRVCQRTCILKTRERQLLKEVPGSQNAWQRLDRCTISIEG